MKSVVSNDELRKLILDSVNMLCDTVSSTLGPSGNNVLISNYDTSPFITNDGVTIAESIDSEDKRIQAILEIIKEASLKTNEVVGDGTTTTLVLLQSIYNLGLKEVIKGKNSIKLKEELDIILDKLINKICKYKKIAKKEDLINIATVSTNSKELGEFLTNLYLKIGSVYGIKVEEGNKEETYYKINKGYNILINELNNLYFTNEKEIVLNNVYLLLINGYLDNLELISEIINEGLNRNKNIVIIANENSEIVKEQILLYNLQEHKNIYVISVSEYGEKKFNIMKDIEYISESKMKNIEYDNILWKDLGYVNKVIIKKDEIVIESEKDNKELIDKIKEEIEITKDIYDKDYLEKRMANLSNSCATIYVGGITNTEIKEKKMRIIDGLCSLKTANDGVVIGEGITLLKLSEELNDNIISEKIIKESLKIPFIKILENSGINYLEIYEKIRKSNYNLIYNIETKSFDNIESTKIIDPLLVLVEALKNAVSIAGMLLTTNYLVINEEEKERKIEF